MAALSIALVQFRPPPTGARESRVAAVWADQAGLLVVLAASISATLGWTQAFAPAANREPGPLAVNIALGLLVAWAAAAVRGWAGLADHLGPLRRVVLSRVEQRLAVLQGDRKATRSSTSRYVAFVLVAAVGTSALLCLVLGYGDIATAGGMPWGSMLVLTPLCALLVWSHVFLAIVHWSAQLGGSWGDRVLSTTVRYMWLILVTVPFGAFVAIVPTLDERLVWIVLVFGPSVLPSALLTLARRAKVGPGLFAVQRAIFAGERTVARLRADLAEIS